VDEAKSTKSRRRTVVEEGDGARAYRDDKDVDIDFTGTMTGLVAVGLGWYLLGSGRSECYLEEMVRVAL
jgi:hypothetical protein